MPRLRFGIKHILSFTAIFALALCSVNTCRHVLSTRAIVALDLPQNKRIRLIQNFKGEPFNTQLYFDAGDGRWGSYYYEHEDWYWNDAVVETYGDNVRIMRDHQCTIQLNTRTATCIVDRADGFHRDYNGPLSYRMAIPGMTEP